MLKPSSAAVTTKINEKTNLLSLLLTEQSGNCKVTNLDEFSHIQRIVNGGFRNLDMINYQLDHNIHSKRGIANDRMGNDLVDKFFGPGLLMGVRAKSVSQLLPAPSLAEHPGEGGAGLTCEPPPGTAAGA